MITTVLLSLLMLLAAYIGGQRRLSILEATTVLSIMGIGGAMIISPDLANSAAHSLGVGRGADLLVYLLALSVIFIAANFYFRFRHLEEKLVVLVRQLSISQALNSPKQKVMTEITD